MGLLGLIIPCNPVYKKRPRFSRFGTYDVQKAEKKFYYLSTITQLKKNFEPLEVPIFLEMEFYMKIPESYSKKKKERMNGTNHTSKPDLDNLVKFIDVWNGILWKDDSQIYKVVAQKFWSTKPRTELRINYD